MVKSKVLPPPVEGAVKKSRKNHDDKKGSKQKEVAEYNSELLKLYGIDEELMADMEEIKHQTQWRNKQRVLVLCSRKVTAKQRHLMKDIEMLLPHSRHGQKWCKQEAKKLIVDEAESQNCNNILFFERRQRGGMRLHMAKCESGPTIIFEVYSPHSMNEIQYAGNHLKYSRPLLVFDSKFSDESEAQLQLMREMFIHVFGTPRNHPKSKPFHDHVLSFAYIDDKIWIRHYQIWGDTPNNPSAQSLTEIGPRLVLSPVRILSEPFGGSTLYFYKDGKRLTLEKQWEQRKAAVATLKAAGKPLDDEEMEDPNTSDDE